MVTPSPVPILKVPTASRCMARIFALTTSLTETKSRVWFPSPKMTGGLLLRTFAMNLGITAAYSSRGFCAGP